MENTVRALARLSAALASMRHPVLPYLSPGIGRDEINHIIEDLPVTLSEETYDLYAWHNGVPDDADLPIVDCSLAPSFSLMSFERSTMYHRYNREQRIWEYDLEYRPGWFPILESVDSTFLYVETSDSRVDVLPIVIHHVEDDTELIYHSIAALADTTAECFETGAYWLNTRGRVTGRPRLVADIGAKYNPGLDYWRRLRDYPDDL